MGVGRTGSQRVARSGRQELSRIRDQFGVVLVLLIVTVFFTISAPNQPWAWLATTATLSATLMIAMVASGAHRHWVRAGIAVAATGFVMSTVIAITQQDARKYLSVTSLLLTMLAAGAIVRRMRSYTEINTLIVLAAVCIYVLLGMSFAFVFECIEEFGSRPFFAAQEVGTRSNFAYFSFVTMATVGYGDLTAQGGLGRAFAVTEGLLGQIYLVTTVAALVGNLGRTGKPSEEIDGARQARDESRPG
ncbi:MAG TPA: potassium channel family protein [Rubrobacter sp.]|nr:potassium channel family protein [Rubrobacter sp.]